MLLLRLLVLGWVGILRPVRRRRRRGCIILYQRHLRVVLDLLLVRHIRILYQNPICHL
jgi:hypothetical protein